MTDAVFEITIAAQAIVAAMENRDRLLNRVSSPSRLYDNIAHSATLLSNPAANRDDRINAAANIIAMAAFVSANLHRANNIAAFREHVLDVRHLS